MTAEWAFVPGLDAPEWQRELYARGVRAGTIIPRPTAATTPLCPAHAAADADWAVTRMAPAPIRLITIGDGKEAWANQRARADDHYALVRQQRAAIARYCADGRKCAAAA